MDTLSRKQRKSTTEKHVKDMKEYAEKFEKEYKIENPVRLIIIGGGNRGKVYSAYALEHPNRAKVLKNNTKNK